MIFGEDWSFVQNPKAASSAVTDALLPYCQPVPPRQLPLGKPSKHHVPHPGCVPLKKHRLGVVRNPYDRMVSAWSYVRLRKPLEWGNVSFREFVIDGGWMIGEAPRLIDFCRTPQITWLSGCNKVFRFEALGEEFGNWSNEHLGRRLNLEHTNASPRSGGFVGYYMGDGETWDTELIDTVRRRFDLDFRAWGYGFH